ncbi:MAG: hypothetical protein AAB631_01970 [Patescibacteria group bacterium]
MNARSAWWIFLLMAVFLAQFHFLGCKEDIVQISPNAPPVFIDDPHGIVGRWYWTESNGGMGGRWTPEKAGYTRTFWFKPDSTFAVYINDTLWGEGHFRVSLGRTPFASFYPVQMIEFYGRISGWIWETKFEVQFPCQDTMVLNPYFSSDVGYSVYGRIKPTPSMAQAKRSLHGSWEWAESYNPFDGTTSPAMVGYRETWTFESRGIFFRFRSDTLFRSGTYRILRESLPPAVKDTLLIVLIRQEGEYDLYGKMKMCGTDALTIDESPFCFNCGYYKFERQ